MLCPIHDNYVLNKLLTKNPESKGMLFTPMDDRIQILQNMVNGLRERGEIKSIDIKISDFERKHEELLCESKYWEDVLPDGYLKTIPTVKLLNAFSKENSSENVRVAIVSGDDNVRYMPTWEGVGSLFAKSDLIVVKRLKRVEFAVDPTAFLSNFHAAEVEVSLPFIHGDKTYIGADTGTHAIKATANGTRIGSSKLYIIDGVDIGMSSTHLRTTVSKFCADVRHYGYANDDVATLINLNIYRRQAMTQAFSVQSAQRHFVRGKGRHAQPYFQFKRSKSEFFTSPGDKITSVQQGERDKPPSELPKSVEKRVWRLDLLCATAFGIVIGVGLSKL